MYFKKWWCLFNLKCRNCRNLYSKWDLNSTLTLHYTCEWINVYLWFQVWDRRTLSKQHSKPVGIFAGHVHGITYVCPKVRKTKQRCINRNSFVLWGSLMLSLQVELLFRSCSFVSSIQINWKFFSFEDSMEFSFKSKLQYAYSWYACRKKCVFCFAKDQKPSFVTLKLSWLTAIECVP